MEIKDQTIVTGDYRKVDGGELTTGSYVVVGRCGLMLLSRFDVHQRELRTGVARFHDDDPLTGFRADNQLNLRRKPVLVADRVPVASPSFEVEPAAAFRDAAVGFELVSIERKDAIGHVGRFVFRRNHFQTEPWRADVHVRRISIGIVSKRLCTGVKRQAGLARVDLRLD